MTTSAEAVVREQSLGPMSRLERHDLEFEPLEDSVEHPLLRKADPMSENDRGLGGRGGADPGPWRALQLEEQPFEAGLLEDDRDKRGRIDDHTPSGP